MTTVKDAILSYINEVEEHRTYEISCLVNDGGKEYAKRCAYIGEDSYHKLKRLIEDFFNTQSEEEAQMSETTNDNRRYTETFDMAAEMAAIVGGELHRLWRFVENRTDYNGFVGMIRPLQEKYFPNVDPVEPYSLQQANMVRHFYAAVYRGLQRWVNPSIYFDKVTRGFVFLRNETGSNLVDNNLMLVMNGDLTRARYGHLVKDPKTREAIDISEEEFIDAALDEFFIPNFISEGPIADMISDPSLY